MCIPSCYHLSNIVLVISSLLDKMLKLGLRLGLGFGPGYALLFALIWSYKMWFLILSSCNFYKMSFKLEVFVKNSVSYCYNRNETCVDVLNNLISGMLCYHVFSNVNCITYSDKAACLYAISLYLQGSFILSSLLNPTIVSFIAKNTTSMTSNAKSTEVPGSYHIGGYFGGH